jgi:hypothetical protein
LFGMYQRCGFVDVLAHTNTVSTLMLIHYFPSCPLCINVTNKVCRRRQSNRYFTIYLSNRNLFFRDCQKIGGKCACPFNVYLSHAGRLFKNMGKCAFPSLSYDLTSCRKKSFICSQRSLSSVNCRNEIQRSRRYFFNVLLLCLSRVLKQNDRCGNSHYPDVMLSVQRVTLFRISFHFISLVSRHTRPPRPLGTNNTLLVAHNSNRHPALPFSNNVDIFQLRLLAHTCIKAASFAS